MLGKHALSICSDICGVLALDALCLARCYCKQCYTWWAVVCCVSSPAGGATLVFETELVDIESDDDDYAGVLCCSETTWSH